MRIVLDCGHILAIEAAQLFEGNILDIQWHRDYETGIAEIDLQHRYFLSLIGRIEGEMRDTNDDVYRQRLIEELRRYAKFHFASEENIMFKLGYPRLELHCKHHIELLDKLSSRSLSNDLNSLLAFLVDWFKHHTVEEDRQIGVFAGRLQAL